MPPILSVAVIVATLSLTSARAVMANTDSGYIVDHGIAIYYAVIPAEIIRGHPKEHPEATMHGGIPGSRYAYHVMVALFAVSMLYL
jgi:hypothetical protein